MKRDHHGSPERRSVLAALGGTALAVPLLSMTAPAAYAGVQDLETTRGQSGPFEASAAAGSLPLTLVNNSGEFSNSSVHVYIVGERSGRQVRVNRAGNAVPVALSDNGANGYTDYSIPLSGNPETHLSLPRMSGRVYLSFGRKLKLKVVTDGNGRPALQHPAGWVASDANYPVLHDCVEFTHNADGMFCNTTMVDMFSVPLNLQLTGRGRHTTGAVRQGGRAQVFAAARRHEAFGRLAVKDLRVIAPGHGLDAGRFPKDYYRPYIDQVWNRYRNRNLTVRTNAGTFTGRVQGERLTFHGPATLAFDRPTTRDILFCNGALAAPNDGMRGPVAAALGAGFNRSVLLLEGAQPTTRAAAFYRTPVTNHYARSVHAAVTGGKAYGFAFDDVGDFASYIQDLAPKNLRLTITPF